MHGYKKEFINFNPDPKLKYYVAYVIANGWLNIEDDEHPLHWMKVKISLSAHVFNNKVQIFFIIYLQGQKRNSSNRISKLK